MEPGVGPATRSNGSLGNLDNVASYLDVWDSIFDLM